MRFVVLIFLLASCTHSELKIYVDDKYVGPVAIIEDYSVKGKHVSIIKIDSVGLSKNYMGSTKTDIQVLNEKFENLKHYQLGQNIKSLERMIFDFGETSITGYCKGKDISYISFYVGTYSDFKKFCEEFKRDELLYFEKNGPSFCDFAYK